MIAKFFRHLSRHEETVVPRALQHVTKYVVRVNLYTVGYHAKEGVPLYSDHRHRAKLGNKTTDVDTIRYPIGRQFVLVHRRLFVLF